MQERNAVGGAVAGVRGVERRDVRGGGDVWYGLGTGDGRNRGEWDSVCGRDRGMGCSVSGKDGNMPQASGRIPASG